MTEAKSPPPVQDPSAPFALQLEWLANRYNPGYFLGGTIRPELHMASLGWHAKRSAGVLAVATGVATLAPSALMLLASRMLPDPWSPGFGLLTVLAGVRLWRAAAPRATSAREEERPQGGKALRVAAMVVLGVLVLAIVGIVIFAVAVIAVAAAEGNAGVIAVVAVLIGLVARRKLERRGARP